MHAHVSRKIFKTSSKSLSAAKIRSTFDYTTVKAITALAFFANGPEVLEVAADILVYR
jgi:hypothetical protein